MSVRLSRRLSIAAVASASLAGIALAPQAGATTGGYPASSPLTYDLGDGTIHTVGGGVNSGFGQDAAWSPDGSKVAYQQSNNLFIANADGSDVIWVANNAANDAHPRFAYDGELLVYTSSQGIWATWANGSVGQHVVNGQLDNQAPLSWPLPFVAVTGDTDSSVDYGGGVIVFQRQVSGATTTGIWVRSRANNHTPFQVAKLGSTPTVSPDGKTVAFVAPDAKGVQQLYTVPTDMPAGGVLPTPVQQTFHVDGVTVGSATFNYGPLTSPVFSPDGKSISFVQTMSQVGVTNTPSTIQQVALITDPKATANPETAVVSQGITQATTLAYRTEFKKELLRLAGTDRLATAVAVSQSQWRTNGDAADLIRTQASVAVLSRSDLPADALAGSALAAHKNGPLMLTDSATLAPNVKDELKRILAPGSTVYLLGGPSALSPNVASQVAALGFTVDRIAGPDRYATAVAIADQVNPNPSDILVATGLKFPDALSAGAAAGANPGAVVVLSEDTHMPAATLNYLHRFGTNFDQNSPITLTAVGGQALAAIDSTNAGFWRVPLVGKDRYQTSYMVAREFFPYMAAVGVATGLNFADALSGGAAMGSNIGPLLLVDPAVGLTPQDVQLLDDNRSEVFTGYVFGGPAALPTTIDGQLANDITGPLGVVDGGGNAIHGSTEGHVFPRGAAITGVTGARGAVTPKAAPGSN